MNDKKIRLQVYMAHSGVASRRKCEQLISEGLVYVNDELICEPGFKVTEGDKVVYNGKQLFPVKNYVYIALFKPAKYISSMSDPDGRAVAADLIKSDYSGRLYNVGRLDYMSTGLLLFTNDGEFARKISHPSTQIEKEYLVETKENIDEKNITLMKKGVHIQGDLYRIKKYTIAGSKRVKVVLQEGKNRELRKLFSKFNYTVKRLQRVRIGSVILKGLNLGEYRFLSEKEINSLLGEKK